MSQVVKRDTRVVLNTNAVLARVLLQTAKLPSVDAIYASLHTTDNAEFKRVLGAPAATGVMANLTALARHGYNVQINFSLGAYNQAEFEKVMLYAAANGLGLKVIAIIRPHAEEGFHAGDRAFVDPKWLDDVLQRHGFAPVAHKAGFGGVSTVHESNRVSTALGGATVRVEVKNVAAGRLATSFCGGCRHASVCGEGMYALRVGTDGMWKPCLVNKEGYAAVEQPTSAADGSADGVWERQILTQVSRMVGRWEEAHMRAGVPQ